MKQRLKGLLALVLSLTMVLSMTTVSYGAANDHADKITVKGTDLTATGYYGMSDLGTRLDTAPTSDTNGYVHWDSSTGTLELYNATISHDGLEGIWGNENYTIVLAEGTSTVTSLSHNAIYSQGSVTIKGSGTLNATGDDNGIECEYTTNISDSATVTIVGKNSGIITKHYGDGVVIDSTGTVTITGSSEYGIGKDGSSNAPKISSPNVMVTGSTAAFQMAPVLGNGITARASTDINGSNPEAYDSTKLNTYKWFKSEVPTPTTYPVKIGGVDFASNNLVIDSTDIAGVNGTATYVPKDGTNPATLTLNNFTFKDTLQSSAISSNQDLTLNLIGENKITASYGSGAVAVSVTGKLAIEGTGSLTASGTKDGIAANGNLTITDATVTATGGDYYDGIYAGENITITNATVTATGDEAGIYSNNTITITGGTVTAEGDTHGLSASNVNIEGGTVTATGDEGCGIYTEDGNVTISGGTVEATGDAYGIFADLGSNSGGMKVTISGGAVTANAADNGGIGIYAYYGEIAISGDNTQVTVGCATGLKADTVNILENSTVTITTNATAPAVGKAIDATTLNFGGNWYQWSTNNPGETTPISSATKAFALNNYGGTGQNPVPTSLTIGKIVQVSTYTVTFNANGHGTAPSPQSGITAGGKVTEPTPPTENGWRFDGWYKEQNCTTKWDFNTDTVTADITLYAKWTENSTGGPGTPQPPAYYPVYIPTVEDEPEVTAPNTFDGGIASAVVVTILSATGGAWLAKKKD